MRLVVLVPLVARMHAIEVPWLAGAKLVFPGIRGWALDGFLHVEQLFLLVEVFLGFRAIQSFGREVSVARRFFRNDLGLFDDGLGGLGDKARGSDFTTLANLRGRQQVIRVDRFTILTSAARASFCVRMSISRSSAGNLRMSMGCGLIARS